jgi:hypothetical protein
MGRLARRQRRQETTISTSTLSMKSMEKHRRRRRLAFTVGRGKGGCFSVHADEAVQSVIIRRIS